jgi:hypothetical protein
MVTVAVVQVTATEVTFAVAVPVPPATVHVCDGLLGWVPTVTAYAPPFATAVWKVNETDVPVPGVMVSLSVPLSIKTKPVPVKPVTVPPIVYVAVVGGVVLPPPPPLLPPGMPLHEARISAVRVMLARANIFLAGIIEILFSFVLRPSQAMTGNNAFRCEHSWTFPGHWREAQSEPKNREPAFSSTIRTESTVTV